MGYLVLQCRQTPRVGTARTTSALLIDISIADVSVVKTAGVTFEGTVADGDVVYWDSGNTRYAKAISDGSAAQNAVGFADVTNLTLEMSGVMSGLTSSLTAGSTYYLSSTVAGDISTTKSSVRMGEARTTSALLININHGEPKLRLTTHFLVG